MSTKRRYMILAHEPEDLKKGPSWTPNASTPGLQVAHRDTFEEVVKAVQALNHNNYSVFDRIKHKTYPAPALDKMREDGYGSDE